MSGNDNASNRFEGFRGVINDIRLLLTDLLGLGRPDAEQQIIIETYFGLMGYVAKADRLVSSHESDLANRIMDDIDLSMAARRLALESFERGMARNINVRAELLRFTDAHPAGAAHNDRLHDILVRLVASDGRLDRREHETMTQITADLGLPAALLEERLSAYTIKR